MSTRPVSSSAPRGYILLLVMMLAALLSAGLVVMLIQVEKTANTGGKMLQRKQTFYQADGVQRTVVALADQFLSSNPEPTQAELDAYFNATLKSTITPAGYDLEQLAIETGAPARADIPNGPFRGMTSRQIPISIGLRLRDQANYTAAEQTADVVLGQLSVFQFYIFADTWAHDHPGPTMNWTGRAHSNYGWCLAGNSGLTVDWVTTSGEIYKNGDSHCTYNHSGSNTLKVRLADNSTVSIGSSDDHGCTNCKSSGKNWKQWTDEDLEGRLQDSSHGVNPLRLPISGDPHSQAGWNSSLRYCDAADAPNFNNCTYKNGSDPDAGKSANSRFVIDPVRSQDTGDIRNQKFAFKADIRIVNGVWYIKEDGWTWPGKPIWSDHPGNHTELDLEGIEGIAGVGQTDINSLQTWGNAEADVPDRFSYYGTHQNGVGVMKMTYDPSTDAPAVVSYGPIHRKDHGSGDLYWYPGHYVGKTSSTSSGEFARSTLGACPATYDELDDQCGDSTEGCLVDASGLTGDRARCEQSLGVLPKVDLDVHAALLNGSRSGYRSPQTERTGWAESSSNTGNKDSKFKSDRGKMLPLNFDVAAFQAALADCTGSELGSYFPGTCNGSGREFNGVVYITNTWDGAMDGFGKTEAAQGHPQEWPRQGSFNDTVPGLSGGESADYQELRKLYPWLVDYTDPANPTSSAINQPLPTVTFNTSDSNDNRRGAVSNHALLYNLCSTSLAGRPFEELGAPGIPTSTNAFTIPDCARYNYDVDTNPIRARTNIVRVINARYVNPKVNRNVAGGKITVKSGILPKGLTIATNLPMWSVGKINIDTNPDELDETDSNYHFVPFLLANDRLAAASDNWEDDEAPWTDMAADSTHYNKRNGSAMTFNAEVFTGWMPATSGNSSGGIHNLIRHVEKMSSYRIRGSLVIGFASVYSQEDFLCCGGTDEYTYSAPSRDFGFDEHLNTLENQPPGSPRYTVSATQAWTNE